MAIVVGCGGSSTHTIRVYENRAARSGRQIDLHVVVLHATGRPVAPDPIVWLTGGPGMAATNDAALVRSLFSALRVHHDIVLVDQRGTGQSAALECHIYDRANLQPYFDTMWPVDKIRDCRQQLSTHADLAQYTTANAMDDLADVLTALGYAKADIIGVSYGTQAAFAFMRRHPDRVRKVVLNGVMPPDQILFSMTPRVDSNPIIDSAMKLLPVKVVLWNWRRLRHDTVTITRADFEERVFMILYAPSRGRRMVSKLRQALAGDWRPFAELALSESFWRHSGRSIGMQLSVLCTENAPRLAHSDTKSPLVRELLAACAEWPRGAIAPEDTTRVISSLPVLLMSGGLDPATPPAMADSAALGLSNSTRFVDSTAGHAMFYDKQIALITSFIM
ncbi:MAG TPA: alpha/beta fold hydrolase [Gemmatimonadaceae bacterium]|nr:alpha/beta fold hydrolase [Gemmatimonadaceae bacterium]